MKMMTTTKNSMESLRSITRSLWRLGIISALLLFSHTISAQCEWTVHVWGSTYGDEVEWTLTDATGLDILSGGLYNLGFDDEQTVVADGPLTFWITNDGFMGDNKPNYEISNGFEIVTSGQLTTITTVTVPDLECEVLDDCVGTPSAGTVGADLSVCGAISFVLNTEGATTAANGLTRTWQSSPAGQDTWTDVPNSVSATFTVGNGVLQATDYRYSVFCDASQQGDVSDIISVTLKPSNQCYCTPPAPTYDDLYWIESVYTSDALSDFSNLNTEFSSNGYGDYRSNYVVSTAPGYEFTLTVANQNGSSPGITVWIDWNQNGTFEDSEKVFFSTSGSMSALNTYTIPISVPVDAISGTTTMRIRNYGSSGSDPCASALYGEVEDYGVDILTLDDCAGTPDAGTVVGPSTICAGNEFTLTVTDASAPAAGYSRQWQSSADGTSWTDIADAFGASYTTSISAPTYFRFTMVCDFAGDMDISDAILVDQSPATDCYCTPSYNYTSDHLTTVSTTGAEQNISFSGNANTNGGKYKDETHQVLAVFAGQQITLNTAYVGGMQTIGIWADWNIDGAFGGAGNSNEQLALNYASSPQSFPLTIPQSTTPGEYRFRVRAAYGNQVSSGDAFACNNQGHGTAVDFTILVISTDDCVGIPSAGNIATANLSVCAGATFNLNTIDASIPASGLTRVWQSSPAGQNVWTDIANSSASYFNVQDGVMEETDFRYSVTCEPSQETVVSDIIEVTLKPGYECYCEPVYSYTGDYLGSVNTTDAEENLTFTGTSANSGGQNIDETDQVLQSYAGQQITMNTAYLGGSQTIGVWADWNLDGIFGGDGNSLERLFLNYSNSAEQSFTLQIPQTVTPGQYRLRVRGSFGNKESDGDAFACNSQSYGTTVDFTIEVVQLDDCVGAPTAGDVDTADFSICAGEPFTLAIVNASAPAEGLTRIWQSSPAGEDDWTDFPNSTSMSFNAPNGVMVDTDFRYSVSCEFSDESDVSDIIQVTLNPGTDCYCDVAGIGSWGSISYVEFSGIENESGPATYTDFTDQTAYVVPGVNYPLTVKVPPGYASSEKVMVWVDWNQNGFFEESEYTYLGTCNGNACATTGITGDIAVPFSALEGVTRMRIMSSDGSEYTDACGNSGSFYGEVEDYSVEVQIGDCLPPNFDYIITNNCDENDTYNVSAILNDFGTNLFVQIILTRSDGVPVFPLTIPASLPQGYNFQLINNVPAGVTVTAAINGVDPVCNINKTWVSMGCYCIPTFSYTGDYVSSVSTNDALTDLTYTGSSAVNGGQYVNATDSILEVYPGQQITLNTAYVGGSQTIGVWADWSKDGIFGGADNAYERLALNYAASPQSFVIDIPENIAADSYRLRVRGVYADKEAEGDALACNPQSFGSAIDFTIQVIQLDDCEGEPFAGTLEEDVILICAGDPFALSTLDATEPANGLTRIWQSSPAGQNVWTDIENASAANFNVVNGIMEDTDFRYTVSCSFSDETDISEVVEVTLKPSNQCYCIPPQPSFTDLYWIESVSTTGALNDISNMNTGYGNASGYNDYSSIHSAVVAPDDEFILNVVNRSGSSPGITVWIDWNQNGIFEDSEEIFYSTTGTSSDETTYTIPVAVPTDALIGTTTMRIRNYGSNGNDPCASASYGEVEDYEVEVISLTACSDTPDTGTVSGPSTICASNNFTLTITGASDPAEGISRQWQSSADGNNWTDIANATNSTYSTNISDPTYFRLTMECEYGGDIATSNALFVDLNPPVDCYCTPTYSTGCSLNDRISNVSLAGESVTLDNSSQCSPGAYGDYTANTPQPDLAPGQMYTLSVSTDYSSPTYEEVTAWIDYNENGLFEPNEKIANTNGDGLPSSGTGTFDFFVPNFVAVGDYRMRVRLVYNGSNIDPCSNETYGETEDYMVEIISLDACTGTPDAGYVDTTAYNVCANMPISLQAINTSEPADGLSGIWQSSPTGQDDWTDIDGASNPMYTSNAGIQVATDFRFKVTCSYSQQTDFSNEVTVGVKPANECYCTPPAPSLGGLYWIQSVSTTGALDDFANMNTGEAANGYADYSDIHVVTVAPDDEFTLNVVNRSGATPGITVWIDWNQDGTFESSEQVYHTTTGNSSAETTYNITIDVPANALVGNTNMRIRNYGASGADPCASASYGEVEDYGVEIMNLLPCIGTPDAGTVSGPSEICIGDNFTLSISGATPPAEGLTRQWQSSSDGDNWTDIADATNSSLGTTISEPTYFRLTMSCENGGDVAYSNALFVDQSPVTECYCTPTFSYTGDYVSSVATTGAESNISYTGTSATSGGLYVDKTDLVLEVFAGQQINLNTAYVGGSQTIGVWADWNQDGIFAGAGNSNERIALNYAASPQSFNVTIPQSVLPGEYRLRVRGTWGNRVNDGDDFACNHQDYGTAIDFTIVVVALDACTGTPSAGDLETEDFSICAGDPFTLTVVNSTDPADGLMRTWQSSPAGQDQWTDIANSSSKTYNANAGVMEDTDFRYSVSCEYSDESDVSEIIHVTLSPGSECYCDLTGLSTVEQITRVVFGDVDHSSAVNAVYVDYTDVVINVEASLEYEFIGEGNTSGSYTNYFTVFIDFNQDGLFDNTTERFEIGSITNSNGNDGQQAVNDITIPSSALDGLTRMRVIKTYNSAATNGCTAGSSFGQVQDFTLLIGEPVWDCPDLSANIGDTCNDGDPGTVNDTVNADCECVGIIPPAGSYCASAIEVECNASSASYNSANSIATNTTSCSMGSKGLWFTFQGTGSDITVTTTASYNHEMSINMGDDCDNITGIACVDAGVTAETYTIENSIEGTNYYVYVANWSSSGTATGVIGIKIECDEAVFDCPDIEANIGDDCYDDAGLPGVIDENCGCFVESTPEFDCPELEANYGDACELADGGEGEINQDCECQFVETPICDMVYYLSDHDAVDGISDIYQVTLNGGVATMSYIETSPIEVHIAYNPVDNMLYAISKHENSYRTLDPVLKIWGAEVALGNDLGQVTAAVFNHDGKLLLGSQNHKVIYSVNVNTNVVSTYDTFAPVYGGDLAYRSDGMLYLATRAGNGLYEVWSAPMNDQLIGILPPKVTGMAITDTDQLLISAQGQTSLVVRNTDGSDPSVSYSLMLDGEAYTLRDGDMASGCNTRPPVTGYCDNFTTYYVNHGPGIDGSDLYRVNFTVGGTANLQFVTNVPFEAHIAFNADANLVFLVNADGSFIRIYDAGADSFVTDLAIGGSFTKLTSALYNANDGLLYIGDHHANEIHTVDLTTGVATYYADGPVSGGDIEILDDGDIYLATRQGAGLYEIVSGGPAEFVGNIPALVTGIARANDSDDSFMISNKNTSVFTQVSAADGSTIETFNIMLNGVPFTTTDGDMAAGCADQVGDDTPPVVPFTSAVEATSNLTSYPNPTNGPSKVVFTTVETTRTLVEVYDMNGRNVATLFDQEAQKDQKYTLDFNGSVLPNGVYIYRLTTKNETIVEKFMIAR